MAPSRVLTLISAPVSLPNFEGVSTLKRHLDLVAGELDAGDLADADAGDADLVVRLDAAGLGEGGVVGVAAADQGQVLRLEGHAPAAPAARRG